MIRMMQAAVLVATLVYPVYSSAQPAMTPAMSLPSAMSHTSSPAPAPARASAPAKPVKRPEPAAMAPVPAMAPATASGSASAAPVPAMAPVMAVEPAKPTAASAAPIALKSEPAKVKKSGWETADTWIKRITSLILLLLSVIGTILGWTKAQDWREKLKSGRWAKVLGYAREYAFPAIEKIAKSTEWKGDDKLAEFLLRVDDWLKGDGNRPLSAKEMALLMREAADLAAVNKSDDPRKVVDEKAVTRRKDS